MNFLNNKITRYFNYTLIILFLVFITFPFVGTVYSMEEKLTMFVNTENRKLAEMPDIDIGNFDFGDYADEMEKYLADNFGFRSVLVKWNLLMHIKWFNTAPITDVVIDADDSTSKKNVKIQGDVIIGDNGWYYYAKEQVIDDYRGVIPLSNSQLEEIKNNLEEKKKWLDDQGIDFIIMVSPNKSSIYPENMPYTINKVNQMTRLDQLEDYLVNNSDITIIDPREDLISAKKDNLVYEITGTHWNEYGAFIAYTKLANYLKVLFPTINPSQLNDYNIEKKDTMGSDLAAMLFIQKYVHDTQYFLTPKNGYQAKDANIYFENPNSNPLMPLVAKEVNNPELPKALIFRDSFMNRIIPYLSENFSRSVYVWTYEISPEIIEAEKPNVVIYEFVERKIEVSLLQSL